MTAGSIPCASCGRPVPAGASSCPACGTAVAARIEPEAAVVVMPIDEPGIDDVAATDAVTAGDPIASGGIVPGGVVLGGYLAPSSVYRAPPPQPPVQAMPRMDPLPPAAEPAAAVRVPTADPAPRPGQAAVFADLPFDAPNTLPEWLVAIGSGLAALSFLLPWAPGIVSYTSSWGLSSLANLPVLALLIATVILAVLPNRVARWVRAGVLPLIAGSMFLGLLWPYVVGDFGAEFGSITGAAAAVVLIVGGILAVAPRRDRPTAT